MYSLEVSAARAGSRFSPRIARLGRHTASIWPGRRTGRSWQRRGATLARPARATERRR